MESQNNKLKKPRASRISDDWILEGIKATGGTDSSVAAWIRQHKKIKVERSTITKHVLANPVLQAAKAEADEETTDMAISKLRKLIIDGDKAAIFFQIKYKGKSRGYISQYSAEIANKEGESFKISTEDAELKEKPIEEVMRLAREHHDATAGK